MNTFIKWPCNVCAVGGANMAHGIFFTQNANPWEPIVFGVASANANAKWRCLNVNDANSVGLAFEVVNPAMNFYIFG